MKQMMNIQCRILGVTGRKMAIPSSFLISFLFLQTSLFAQIQLNTITKQIHSTDSLNDIAIHQDVNFNVTPQKLYGTLLSSKEFSDCIKLSFPDFTEKSATIDSIPGGLFSLFDGHIIGRFLELVPYKRIVEAWRVVDWPPGVYSIATFEFKPLGSGTHLEFDHIGFPKGLKEHLSIGWQQHFWDALGKYFK